MKVKQQKPSSTSRFPRSDASTLRGGRRVRDVARWGNPGGLGGMDGVQYIMVLFVPRLGPKTWDFMISCFFLSNMNFCRTECWMDGVYVIFIFCLYCQFTLFLGKDWLRTKNRILTFWIQPPNPGPHELLGAISRLPKMVIRVVFGCCGWIFEDNGDDHLYMVVSDIGFSKHDLVYIDSLRGKICESTHI